MQVYRDIQPCREAVRNAQRDGGTVGLVPTMGALHEGHLSLVRAARRHCSTVAVTIFVNPTQFGPHEDYDAYPRTWASDHAVCEAEGVGIVFAPTVETMYPPDSLTVVRVGRITDCLCGPVRPGHFDGVATVVAKLFNILPADRAYFGEKDYQQLQVIRRMALDLNMPVEVVGCPIIREPDGLAMSSRNAYLSTPERRQAAVLSQSLRDAASRIAAGDRDVASVVDGMRQQIVATGLCEIDYIDVVDATTLETLTSIDRPARICLAVRIGTCRLIDNIGVDAPTASN